MSELGDRLRLTASQSFNEQEVEALNELMALLLRGGDARVMLKRPAMRNLARKFATMKERIALQKLRREGYSEEPMRALTLWQPWASVVGRVHDGKDIENRKTLCPPKALLVEPRPFFAIHAGATYDASPESAAMGVKLPPGKWAFPPPLYGIENHVPTQRECPTVRVVAVARVRYALDMRDPARPKVLGIDPALQPELWREALEMPTKRWWLGPIGWQLFDRFALTTPVVARGALGVWEMDADTEAKVRAAMPDEAKAIDAKIRGIK